MRANRGFWSGLHIEIHARGSAGTGIELLDARLRRIAFCHVQLSLRAVRASANWQCQWLRYRLQSCVRLSHMYMSLLLRIDRCLTSSGATFLRILALTAPGFLSWRALTSRKKLLWKWSGCGYVLRCLGQRLNALKLGPVGATAMAKPKDPETAHTEAAGQDAQRSVSRQDAQLWSDQRRR